jgi:hypothetical protein
MLGERDSAMIADQATLSTSGLCRYPNPAKRYWLSPR